MRLYVFLLSLSLIVCPPLFSETPGNPFSYMDPLPNAKFIKKESSLILTPSESSGINRLNIKNFLEIRGSKSGVHRFEIINIENSRSFIVKPLVYFDNGEVVTISLKKMSKGNRQKLFEPFSYSFCISEHEQPYDTLIGLVNELSDLEISKLRSSEKMHSDNSMAFPEITVTHSNNPSAGFLFLSNIVFNIQIPNTPHLLILNNDGTPFFSRQMQGAIYNFDRQPNGNYTYFSRSRGKYYELDTNYILKDSFYTGNGYLTDLHELRVLPNRHAYLMSYDEQVVDMSQYIEGGNANAHVTGVIVQEIDENKNVVFQWRSWDHYQITDASHENLLNSEIDYVHANAIEIDTDGNILLSSRNMDEITKINRSNGNIIWRLGGKNNQFTFINDPEHFCYQHAVRRISSGNITLFDNGNYHPVSSSRGVEYSLDEINYTATVVWEYHNSPYIYGGAMGNVQRLSNGNTLICWGAINPTVTEIKPDGSKALELTFETGVFSYRVFKYEFGQGITSVGDPVSEMPRAYELFQNYPNPFNPVTKIKFKIPKNDKTTLKVFDVLGRELKTLLDENITAGTYEIDFDGSKIPSGVYFYKVTSGGFTEMKKMILVK